MANKLNTLRDALDAAYPIPDTPHESVKQRARESRTAFIQGWQSCVASTALQAPVREVPGADHLTGKWCYSRDGEEFTGPFDTEGEAHAEAQGYAEEGEHYWVGQIKHPADCIGSDRNIGDGIITCADETAYDECGGDDRAFDFSHEQCEQLGAMVREFIRREGSVNRWAVVGSTQHAVPEAPVLTEPKP